MGRKAGGHNQWNTGSRAAPSFGRPVLSIADNPEDYSQLQRGGVTTTQHSVTVNCNAVDYSRAAHVSFFFSREVG